MSNLIVNTEFVLNEAKKQAIKNFEKNVKGEFVSFTEKGIKIKVLNKNDNSFAFVQAIPKGASIKFENLNSSAALSFNNISKDNAKFAAVYYQQIKSIQHSISIIKKMSEDDLKKAIRQNSQTDDLFSTREM
ncbi:hypothetical protein RZE82_07825 [Mollicutes bacterium LVI A0039]|nr:hypothetical protein RZE82_07825 [Mollicutes bacterium LVI A0039]